MKNAVKGALLSGLVLPGLGQLVLGRYRRGALILVGVLAALAMLVALAVRDALLLLEKIELEGGAIDANGIAAMAARESTATGSLPYQFLLLFVLLCWIGATVDAWRIGRQLDEGRQEPDRHRD